MIEATEFHEILFLTSFLIFTFEFEVRISRLGWSSGTRSKRMHLPITAR